MQALILAAGMGKRLGKHTSEQTKCMVKVNGKTLIEHTMDALKTVNDLSRVVVVIGYKGKKLKTFLNKHYKDMNIVYVNNPIYDRTNNIYSLYLAKNHLLKDDTILLESDLIFEKRVIKDIVNNPNENLTVVSKFESWMDGTVTILDEDENIISFIPKKELNWDHIDNYYKTVNIYKFSKEFSKKYYLPFLEAYINALGDNEYYEQVLKVIADLDKITLKAHKLVDEKWYEIDDIQDLDIAETIFSDPKLRLAIFQQRYGGYWRYPKLKDFCYLVNPYFPDKNMINEIKSSMHNLITQYPSGQDVQNLLASKVFNCNISEILVGNGASELIRAITRRINGNFGVVFPTFNEYPESIDYNRVKKYILKNQNFNYTVNDLMDFSKDLKALVLINPDNPSGYFLDHPDIIKLLEYLDKKNIYLIFDESFIDFADKEKHYSLIKSEILQKYKKLIVIKSISKSYGVPGLRLGVAANGDPDLVLKIKKELSIWNINSFGEFFLQIIDKYKADYKNACEKISMERDRFYNALSKINYLRVIRSQTNYFLCEVISKYTSTSLTQKVLSKYEILLKDLFGKIGFEKKNYIRIAIRNSDDNNYLVDRLTELS